MSLVFEVAPAGLDDVVRCKVRGELDLGSANQVKDAFERIMRRHPTRIEADLSELTFCDSVGLGVFLEAQLNLENRSTELRIIDPSDQVCRLFALTGVGSRFALGPSADPVNFAPATRDSRRGSSA